MSIVLFIVILAVLIFVHELGHFLSAKLFGIRVDEFSLGFPPRIWKKKYGETTYSVGAFPIGGFVKIFGEDAEDSVSNETDRSRHFSSKPHWVQGIVISSGVFFNILLAYLLISFGFMIGVPYSADNPTLGAHVVDAHLTVESVYEGSPAFKAGITPGDRILELASGEELLTHPTIAELQEFVGTQEHDILLTYERHGATHVAVVTPETSLLSETPVIGISLSNRGILKLPMHEALLVGFSTTVSVTKNTFVGIVTFLTSLVLGDARFNDISGPVGIVSVVHDAALLGSAYIISLVALISINLAIINLLPFPALDGGRLLFIFIESMKGSPLKPVVANALNSLGFLLLILLMVVVTYHDIVKLIVG